MTDANSKFHILSDDLSRNSLTTLETISNFSLFSGMGMWGEGIWGSILILGSGMSNSYVSGIIKNVLSLDIGLNAERRTVNIYEVTMLEPMLQWGAAEFGTNNILGSGTLITSQG